MHRKETLAYIVNLENDVPIVYVVATDSGENIVEAIPMIEPLVAWVEKFVDEHQQEEVL